MAAASQLIDREHLDRQTMGDKELAREVLGMFLEQMRLRLDSLAIDAPDLKEQAHSIKGSARSIGAWDLAKSAEMVELGDGEPSHLLPRLKEDIRRTSMEVEAIVVAE